MIDRNAETEPEVVDNSVSIRVSKAPPPPGIDEESDSYRPWCAEVRFSGTVVMYGWYHTRSQALRGATVRVESELEGL